MCSKEGRKQGGGVVCSTDAVCDGVGGVLQAS